MLLEVADFIQAAPVDGYSETRLRGLLSNLKTGYALGHFDEDAMRRRCRLIRSHFLAGPNLDRSTLEASFVVAMDAFGEQDHYCRGDALADHLDDHAVTFQSDAWGKAGEWWLGRFAHGSEIALRFKLGGCSGHVGKDGKPLWLTPYVGEVRLLCEEAQSLGVTDARRTEMAERILHKLGLCHFRPQEGVLAFITQDVIGDLAFDDPSGKTALPRGSTAIEARSHIRYRPWPRPAAADAYGRTYDLDPDARTSTSPPRHHGAPEANRPRMAMSAFSDCIFIGETPVGDLGGSATDYLEEIDAGDDAVSLLRDIARLVP